VFFWRYYFVFHIDNQDCPGILLPNAKHLVYSRPMTSVHLAPLKLAVMNPCLPRMQAGCGIGTSSRFSISLSGSGCNEVRVLLHVQTEELCFSATAWNLSAAEALGVQYVCLLQVRMRHPGRAGSYLVKLK